MMIPSGETRGAELVGERLGEPEDPFYWEDYAARLLMPRPEDGQVDEFRLYLGPWSTSAWPATTWGSTTWSITAGTPSSG
ncbi:hypothetical protein [Rhodothermus marinus]|uniref:hypothetical protein n=1 Tax=Rhodothermus marinus TaxID=29549 RepID=UPI001FB222E5|nr:hypothetical protein [Rhodothermus marinus]